MFHAAIVSMVMAILAYQELAAISGDVFDVLNNWQRKPVVNITVIDWTEECPHGYSLMSIDNTDFPGIKKGHCGCSSNPTHTSGLHNCSDEAELTDFCMSYIKKSSVPSTSWRGKRLCVLRGGEPAESWKNGYRQRPHPNSEGICPEGYRKCGQGDDHNNARALCFPEEEPLCPLTNIVVSESIPSTEGWDLIGEFNDGYSLFGRREGYGELPLVDLQIKLTTEVGQSFRDGKSYSTGRQNRGPCYMGPSQVIFKHSLFIRLSKT